MYFTVYKDEAYYSLSPKKRKIVDMQQRGYIDEDGQIDEDAIYDDACEAAEELAVFLRAVFNNPKEDSKKLIKFLDNLWTAGKYKQLQATLIGFELLFEFPEKYFEDVECCLGEARKSYLSTGKKYRNHYATICSWAVKEQKNIPGKNYDLPEGKGF